MSRTDLKDWNPNSKKRVRSRDSGSKEAVVESAIPTPSTEGLVANSWLIEDKETGKEREYFYNELLKRIYDEHRDKKGLSGEGPSKIQIEPPQVGKVGTRRVVWTNFAANCRTVNRKPEHVQQFVLAELGTTGDLGEGNKLLIKGRYSPKQLEVLLKKYISKLFFHSIIHLPSRICYMQNMSQP
eukprot:TRINITY_DN18_c0_g1_i1.p1 TRINITY_DN18_c0_g1~~TRINITY_DN18_c0_g1_i1.p1  ORF type:complete len:184 (+),score=37.00 TRINITY_DN18_c0_g1_i1:54-605(+)